MKSCQPIGGSSKFPITVSLAVGNIRAAVTLPRPEPRERALTRSAIALASVNRSLAVLTALFEIRSSIARILDVALMTLDRFSTLRILALTRSTPSRAVSTVSKVLRELESP